MVMRPPRRRRGRPGARRARRPRGRRGGGRGGVAVAVAAAARRSSEHDRGEREDDAPARVRAARSVMSRRLRTAREHSPGHGADGDDGRPARRLTPGRPGRRLCRCDEPDAIVLGAGPAGLGRRARAGPRRRARWSLVDAGAEPGGPVRDPPARRLRLRHRRPHPVRARRGAAARGCADLLGADLRWVDRPVACVRDGRDRAAAATSTSARPRRGRPASATARRAASWPHRVRRAASWTR